MRRRLPLLKATFAGCAIAGAIVATSGPAPARTQAATIALRCAGSELVANLTLDTAGVRILFVEFVGPLGARARVMSPPYEARWGSRDYPMPATVTVSARIYTGSSRAQFQLSEEVQPVSWKRCPRRIVKQPPLLSRAADDATLAKVTLGQGLGFGEVEELWGTPKSSACHGTGGRTIDGRVWSGYLCGWGITLTGGGVSEGEISAAFGNFPGSGLVLRAVSLDARGKRSPRYRGWRTKRGIGLRSSLSDLRRAYGGRLRRVPWAVDNKYTAMDVWYVVTTRGTTRIVTSFSVRRPAGATQPFEADNVEGIALNLVEDFHARLRNVAKPSWRP